MKVKVDKRLDPVVYVPPTDQLDIEDAIKRAGWSKDPGTGVAVILKDGREVTSPVMFEDTVEIEEAQDMMAVLERRIMQKLRQGLFTGEHPEELEDVDINRPMDWDMDMREDMNYVSGFEVEMADEFPSNPAPAPRPGREPAAGAVEPVAEPLVDAPVEKPPAPVEKP